MDRLPEFLCFIAVLATVVAQERKRCDGPLINGTHYSKERLKNLRGVDSATYDKRTNTIYLCYTVSFKKTSAARLNLDSKEFESITGPDCNSILATGNDVYIGGDIGIFKYNKVNKKTELYASHNSSISNLYFKDALYFTDASHFVYRIENGVVSGFEDLQDTTAEYLVIDDHGYTFFLNDTGLYSKKDGVTNVAYLRDDAVYSSLVHLGPGLFGLTVNNAGDVYAYGFVGVFVFDRNATTFGVVTNDSVYYALVFDDHNDMIYSDLFGVCRLKPSSGQDCV